MNNKNLDPYSPKNVSLRRVISQSRREKSFKKALNRRNKLQNQESKKKEILSLKLDYENIRVQFEKHRQFKVRKNNFRDSKWQTILAFGLIISRLREVVELARKKELQKNMVMLKVILGSKRWRKNTPIRMGEGTADKRMMLQSAKGIKFMVGTLRETVTYKSRCIVGRFLKQYYLLSQTQDFMDIMLQSGGEYNGYYLAK